VVGLNIVDEVQPGVPRGTLLGGRCDGLRVVTKAGGFGDEGAIMRAIKMIQGSAI